MGKPSSERGSTSALGDAGRDVVHIGRHGFAGEGQRDQENEKYGDNLGHEYQRHFLDLGERLDEADDHANDERRQHGGGGDLDQKHDRVARKIESFGSGHDRVALDWHLHDVLIGGNHLVADGDDRFQSEFGGGDGVD